MSVSANLCNTPYFFFHHGSELIWRRHSWLNFTLGRAAATVCKCSCP